MYQTKKDNQWYFGMKAYMGMDAGSGMVHTVEATAANVHDVDIDEKLIRQDGAVVYGDFGDLDLPNRPEIQRDEHESRIECLINRSPSPTKTPDIQHSPPYR